ncbi:MAG: 16S rRNA (adenine(1518)-N(6)/adenine(1519)-N(6))-dimethyltransferase, partial [Clostridiales bacterium]|nr:16S rRNA (adenine(1518)-N(6)/adenine(1519)-N(6))-dimethyltransferase [Clostridiales bacterium]
MNLCDKNTIEQLLTRHGFHFSRSLGQNFLIEDWVPRDIAEAAGLDDGCGVLEIGPGIGPLTQELCRRAGRVVSVELDQRLLPVLQETMADFPQFTLLPGDIMKTDLKETVSRFFVGLRPVLCANLPYNITTPLLTKCLEARCFDSITVLIQKEVAQRICAAPGTSDFGAFSLLMQYYT